MGVVEIYALRCPTTNDIRYIGKANDSQKRLKTHLRDSSRRNTPVYCWIRKLISQKLIPIVEVLKVTDSDNWKQDEIKLIAEYRSKCKLLNVASGGDEPHCSKEQRAINGKNTAKKIHGNPELKRIWELKHRIGNAFKYAKKNNLLNSPSYQRLIAACKYAAAKKPHLFSEYAKL